MEQDVHVDYMRFNLIGRRALMHSSGVDCSQHKVRQTIYSSLVKKGANRYMSFLHVGLNSYTGGVGVV